VKEVFGEPAQFADALWRPIAGEQLERRRRGEPLTHRLLELPGVSRRSMALLGPLYGPLVDGWIWPREIATIRSSRRREASRVPSPLRIGERP
jgi:hypothetical protein